MKVKELERTVNVSWSPAAQHPILLAAGTAAQQLDASFSTSAALEIYSLNLTEPGLDMELRASVPSEHRFHKVAWGTYGFGREHENGIVVGGCDGGHVQIYSAAKLLGGEEGLIAKPVKHTGPSNLLATGASESEIFIWDLNNIDTPMLPGTKSQPTDDVLWISWNRQVQHILASTFAPRCVVWDLRKNEPIIKLSDSTSRIRWKVVAWHPEVATQLCLASEEDQTPVIQLWDLRFATSPLKVLENHQRGVLSIAWCPQDPDLLVSCSKDNRILCWNPNSNVAGGEIVCDITTANQWNFDVSWCPRNPALIASASFDGRVSVYSLTGGQQQVQTSTKFGGKLVSFGNEQAQPGQNGLIPRTVYVSQLVTEPELISRSNQLETTLQYGQYVDFCQAKVATSSTPHERSVWNFLRASFDPNPRAEILDLLGFKTDEINMKLGRYIGKPANARPSGDIDGLSDRVAALGRDSDSDGEADGSESTPSTSMLPDGDASAAFDAIAASASSQVNGLEKPPLEPFKILTGDDNEGLICQALLLGNTEAAVEMCIQNGRMADAIILAMTGGSDLLARTQFLTEDWNQVIGSCEVDSWKEALAATLTYTKNDEFPILCELLGSRLEVEGKGPLSLNAQLCYICAGNLNKLVESWTRAEHLDSPSKVQQLVELAMLLRKAVEQQGRTVEVSGKLADLLSRYASMLASQGNLTAALTYLQNSHDEQMMMLHDRLYKALGLSPAYAQHQQRPQPQQNIPHPQSRMSASRQSIGSFAAPQPQSVPSPYGQGFGAPAVQPTPAMYPVQQQPAPTAKPFGGQGMYPPTSAPKPVAQPFAPTVAPPKPFSPGPVPATVQTLHSLGRTPPWIQMFIRSPGIQPKVETKLQIFQGGANAASRKPYVIDPSVQTGPQYGAAPGMYQGGGGFNLNPVANNPAMSSYQPKPANPMYPNSGDIYNPADNMNPQPMAQVPTIPPVNAPPGWNDPPVIKNAPRNQPKAEYTPPNPITHPLYGAAPQESTPMPLQNPLKRKLEEVARKLESLYDALRENKLSPNTLQGLHQMVQMVQIGDYTGGLGLHTQLVSGPDFSQIASFMPGIKVLLQSALQLGVYLQ
ncbi:Protein transport protein Sec31A [Blattella germanica]|nr:Protein transport protein Sec31A [Blattella germanica]